MLRAAEPSEPGIFRSPSNARPLSSLSRKNAPLQRTQQSGVRSNTMRGGNDALSWGRTTKNRLRSSSRNIRQASGQEPTPAKSVGVPMLLNSPRIARQPPASVPPATGQLNDSQFPLPAPQPQDASPIRPGDQTTDPFTDDTFPPANSAPPTAPDMNSLLPQDPTRGGEFQPPPTTDSAPPSTTPYGPPPTQPNTNDPNTLPYPLEPVPQTPSSPESDVTPESTPILPSPNADLEENEDESACKEIYNGRDCCKEAENCQAALKLLKMASIKGITLDITPKFTPDKTSFLPPGERANTSEIARARQFENLEPRNWKDRRGQVVTNGRFTDFVNGRVLIETTGGETVRIPYNALSDDDICYVSAWWQIPSECKHSDETYGGRQWLASTMTWKASALCHKPLYFEQVQLERYGHTAGPLKQPILSGAHFFGSIATLPYKMGIHPPRECQYALGYYRPGSCAPWMIPPVPISLRGALAEAAVLVGGTYLIP